MKHDRHPRNQRSESPLLRPVPPRQPLSRMQHWLLGIAMVFLLLVLFILAIIVRQWQVDVTTPVPTTTEAPTKPAALDLSSAELSVLAEEDALARGSQLVAGIDQPIQRIHPLYASSPGELDSVSLIFESLVQLNPLGQVQMELAESFQYDPDHHLLTVTLAEGHLFSDGTAVTPQDAVWTYQLLLSPAYDGPLRGFCTGILSVSTDPENSRQIAFLLADWVGEPDMAWFTVGILKASDNQVDLERVFELGQSTPSPIGSGAYVLESIDQDTTVLTLRSGYDFAMKLIEFKTLASEDLFFAVSSQAIDVAYAVWDERLTSRLDDLKVYTFQKTAVQTSYLIVNRLSEGAEELKSERLQNTVLGILAGQKPSESDMQTLDELAKVTLKGYCYQGIDAYSQELNLSRTRDALKPLTDLGIQVDALATDWPDLASRALEGRFDLMILPRPANEVLPKDCVVLNTRLLTIAMQNQQPIVDLSTANTVPVAFQSYAVLAHQRLQHLILNPNARPLTVWPLSWTEQFNAVTFIPSEVS